MKAILLAILTNPTIQGSPPPTTPQYKPYSEVVTKEAKSQDGVFKVHQVGEKFYFEIPGSVLGKDMMWQAQEVAIPFPMGGPGPQDYRVVRWARRGSKIDLMGTNSVLRSAEPSGIDEGIKALMPDAILATFKVEAESADKAAVIDVSDFLISDPKDLNIAPSWNATLDKNRSYVKKVKAFPRNVEMQSMLTFSLGRIDTLTGSTSSFAFPVGPNASVLMHYSFLLLPEEPMRLRYRDPRIGYFGKLVRTFGGPEHRGVDKEIIARFRLEKKDPSAALSEPVQPIVYYMAREVPAKWRPFIKRAVEAWQPAFEQAGFKNAIVCKDAPTVLEDPDWDVEDARYSVIRWIPTGVENAYGVQFGDPRSGEIISGKVVFYHDFLSWLQNTYFSQVAHLDPAARRLPFDDKLTGRLLQFIMTHEVGHTLGLEHNMKASHSYSIANLRDAAFVAKHDIASSIMDYARFNYVAQPGDGVPLDRRIGEYDKFAIEWGYKEFPRASGPEEEQPHLNSIAARQNTNPRLRFGNYVHPEDPTAIGEDLSNDPLEAARLGIQNVRRVAKLLVPAAVRPDKDYKQLGQTYAFLVRQHTQLLDNAIWLVGGVYADDHLVAGGGPIYRPVPAGNQRAAVRFLCSELGVPPAELLSPAIASRLFPSGDVSRAMNFQAVVVGALFSERRIMRMFDQEAALGSKAYTVRDLVEDVQNGIWRQLAAPRPVIDLYQRQLQRSYLASLDTKLNGSTATRTELMALARASLQKLARKLDKAIPKAGDEATRLHLADSRRQIEAILKGTSPASKVVPPAAAPPRTTGAGHQGCFYDLPLGIGGQNP